MIIKIAKLKFETLDNYWKYDNFYICKNTSIQQKGHGHNAVITAMNKINLKTCKLCKHKECII